MFSNSHAHGARRSTLGIGASTATFGVANPAVGCDDARLETRGASIDPSYDTGRRATRAVRSSSVFF